MHTYVFPSSVLREPKANDTPAAVGTSSPQLLVSKYHPLIKRMRATWINKCLAVKEQGKYQMNPEHFVLQESKEVLKKDETYQTDIGTNGKGPNLRQLEQ